MKAIRVHEFGGPEVLRLEEVEAPKPGAHQVVVRVVAVGVNPVEAYMRAGMYPRKPELPYTPGADGMNERNSLTINILPEDAPTDVEGYATKLQEKDFQDFGFKYTAIKDKTKLADGWLITGTAQGTGADDKPEPGFVVVRDIGGAKVRCKSMTMKSEKIRTDAIELCKSLKL